MKSADVAERPDRSATPSRAQARIIAAALDLFARHGVGGTSLQMIADEIGVTKAAVYHQYRTKEEIVLAAAEAELARLEAVIAAAEAESSPERAREAALVGIVDLAIERRGTVSAILRDPVITELFADHEAHRDVMNRLRRLLLGNARGAEPRLQIAVLVAAVSGAVMHPEADTIDDKVLRTQLLRMARRFLDLPD